MSKPVTTKYYSIDAETRQIAVVFVDADGTLTPLRFDFEVASRLKEIFAQIALSVKRTERLLYDSAGNQ